MSGFKNIEIKASNSSIKVCANEISIHHISWTYLINTPRYQFSNR